MGTTALSATDVAISMARELGTLRVTREFSQRLGNEFWAISDESGLIEVHLSEAEALRRAGAA